MSHIQIYQSFHKAYTHNSQCDWVQPVGVSGFQGQGFISDADGENISHLNKYYCELTTQYHVWKNRKSDYVGFYHYRRYLNYLLDENYLNYHLGKPDTFSADESSLAYLTCHQQYQALQGLTRIFDVITPRKSPLLPSIASQYTSIVENRPWNLFIELLQDKYSDGKASVSYFDLLGAAPICNVFIMKWDLFDQYCRDLFDIVDTVYQKIGTPFNDYNNRYPGFLAERFLGFWLAKNKVHTAEVPLISFQ